MPITDPPPLPRFLRGELPFPRKAYRLETGPDAGRVIHSLDAGPPDARQVVLVHGNPTWSFLWREVIEALQDPFRCLAPDLLGFGLSSKLWRAGDHSVERHLVALEEWARSMDLRDGFILVGQDWGGPLAAGLGARLERQGGPRVGGLVLGNTAVLVPPAPRGTWFHRFAATPLVSDAAFRLLGFPQRDLARVQGDPRSIRGRVARAYRWPLGRFPAPLHRAGPLGLARMVPTTADHPSLPALREIEAWVRGFAGPLALVWGERDPILGRALERHERELPGATVTRTQAGHFLQEEVPELLAEAVRDVVARAERGAPEPSAQAGRAPGERVVQAEDPARR